MMKTDGIRIVNFTYSPSLARVVVAAGGSPIHSHIHQFVIRQDCFPQLTGPSCAFFNLVQVDAHTYNGSRLGSLFLVS